MKKFRHGRGSPRVLCARLLEIEFLDSSAPSAFATGVVEDVSERGACISLDIEVQPGAEVMLRGSDRAVRATVRHCTADELGTYHVGLEFATGLTATNETMLLRGQACP